MPEFGRIPASLAVAPAATGSAPGVPWDIAGVTAQMATFEVDVEAVLDLLPEMLSRPAPPYCRILVLKYPESPVGAYEEALLLVSSRFAMLPRHFVAASVVTTKAAQEANLANWRYFSDVGEVDLQEDGSGFRSTIRHSSGLEVRIDSPNAQETGPAVIRYDPVVVVAALDGSEPSLVTVSADPSAVSRAWLATSTTVSYAGGDAQSAWSRLRSRNPITGTIAIQDMHLPEPVPVKAMAGVGGGLP